MLQKFPVTIITDNMVAYLLSLGKSDQGNCRSRPFNPKRDIANKIGTYQIAVVARYFKVPFYVLCPPAVKN